MTRTVFDNEMTAHVWANQGASHGRSNNGNLYFTGRTLYSYGSHFIVGIVLPGGHGPVITADRYSVSTARHISYAERATSYRAPNLPGLTNIAPALIRLAEGRAVESKAEVRRYLDRNGPRLSDEAGGLLLRLLGSKADWQAFKVRAVAKAARQAETERKARVAACRKNAAEIAALPLDVVKARAMADGQDRFRPLRNMIESYRDAHKCAGGPRIKAAVWQRLKAVRAIAKRLEARQGRPHDYDRNTARQGLATLRRVKIRDWTVAKAARPDDRFPFGRRAACRLLEQASRDALRAPHMPVTIRAALARQMRIAEAAGERISKRETERAEVQRARAMLRQTVTALRSARDFYVTGEGGPERFAGMTGVQQIRQLTRLSGELDDLARAGRFAYLSARLESVVRPAIAERMAEAEAEHERAEAEYKANRARIAAMSPAERLDAWRAGETGVTLSYGDTAETGPLLRAERPAIDGCTVTGGELVTSQGARVPLRHAFRVFQFVASCRAAGKGWKPGAGLNGPRQIRVGHFTVDSIAPSGDFIAGCHAIKWPEIAALAERLGVADCMADVSAIAAELETAA